MIDCVAKDFIGLLFAMLSWTLQAFIMIVMGTLCVCLLGWLPLFALFAVWFHGG